MALPLLLLLLGASPAALHPRAARMTVRTESVSAVDGSAAQRFGWIDAVVRPPAVAGAPMQRAQQWVNGRALQLFSTVRAELELVTGAQPEPREVARAARWIDALPFKVDAQDGGLSLTLRLRGG